MSDKPGRAPAPGTGTPRSGPCAGAGSGCSGLRCATVCRQTAGASNAHQENAGQQRRPSAARLPLRIPHAIPCRTILVLECAPGGQWSGLSIAERQARLAVRAGWPHSTASTPARRARLSRSGRAHAAISCGARQPGRCRLHSSALAPARKAHARRSQGPGSGVLLAGPEYRPSDALTRSRVVAG